MIKIFCQICNKEFLIPSHHLKLKFRKYCSRKCAHKGQSITNKGKHFSPTTEFKKGGKLSQSHIEKMRKALIGLRLGNKHPMWKGGRRKLPKGYVLIYQPNHPFANRNFILEHRFIMEKYLGRYLTKKEVVHHINGIKNDNRIENLRVMTITAHKKFHRKINIKI